MIISSFAWCVEDEFGLPALTLRDANAANVCSEMMDYSRTPLAPLVLAKRPIPPTASAAAETVVDGDVAVPDTTKSRAFDLHAQELGSNLGQLSATKQLKPG